MNEVDQTVTLDFRPPIAVAAKPRSFLAWGEAKGASATAAQPQGIVAQSAGDRAFHVIEALHSFEVAIPSILITRPLFAHQNSNHPS